MTGTPKSTAGTESAGHEVAFYYPGPVWRDGNLMKNLLLFFDGLALLVPAYMRDKPLLNDPAIAEALDDAGLLHILEPESFITPEATRALTDAVIPLLDSDAFVKAVGDDPSFHEISMSRLGFSALPEVAEGLLAELRKRGLAGESRDGVSIPMRPMARYLILTLWAQLLRPVGRSHGLELAPATDRPEISAALANVLGRNELVSAGHVLDFDLRAVSVDLSAVPIDDVLEFRRQEGTQYRAYATNLRRFLRDLGPLTPEDRKAAFAERERELAKAAEELVALVRGRWRRAASFSFGLVGAAWRAAAGDVLGAAISLGQAAAGASAPRPGRNAEAYAYVLRAARRLR